MPEIDSATSDLQASYALCRQVCRRSRSSFYPAFRSLRPEKLRAMEAIYAFCRFTDDLVDRPGGVAKRDAAADADAATQSEISGIVDAWGRMLRDGLADDSPQVALPPRCRPGAADNLELGRQILPAVIDAVKRFGIPAEYLLAVLDGVRMDLMPPRFETFCDLEDYCRKVASAVGVACLYIWGFEGEGVPAAAHQCGLALQLTNILRDLAEDVRGNRFYLPMEDLRRFGCSWDDLKQGHLTPQWLSLLDFEIARAATYYRGGEEVFASLQPDGRPVFGLMMSVYWELLKAIARRKESLLNRPIKLSSLKKLGLGLRWTLWPPRQFRLVGAPAVAGPFVDERSLDAPGNTSSCSAGEGPRARRLSKGPSACGPGKARSPWESAKDDSPCESAKDESPCEFGKGDSPGQSGKADSPCQSGKEPWP